MQYYEYLKSKLSSSIPDDFPLPKKFHLVGHVVLLMLNFEVEKYIRLVGEATLQYDQRIKSVAVRTGPTKGVTRKPTYTLVAGNPDTLTTHIESGVKFRVDPLRFTFSGGNKGERISLPGRVGNYEHVVDMFACVGQFGLHIAKRTGARVTAIEVNPKAFVLLEENIKLNRVQDRMDAILGDCREVHPLGVANRVVMGYLHDTISFLPHALETIHPTGGVIHMHMTVYLDDVNNICNTINTICEEHGFKASVSVRMIKSYSPGVCHFSFDISLEKQG